MTILNAVALVLVVVLVAAAGAIAVLLWMAMGGIDDDAGRPGSED